MRKPTSWEDPDIFPLTADHKRLAELNSGRKYTPLANPEGVLTLGVGRRLYMGLNDEEIDLLLYNDLSRARRALLEKLPWTLRLDPVRFAAVQELAMLSGTGWVTSKRSLLLEALEADDFDRAASQITRTVWAAKYPKVSQRLAKMLMTGEWPWTPVRHEQTPEAFPLTFER